MCRRRGHEKKKHKIQLQKQKAGEKREQLNLKKEYLKCNKALFHVKVLKSHRTGGMRERI